MKNLLKSILSYFGYNLIQKNPSKVWVNKVETPHGRRANFLQHLGIQVVVDVGAHTGWYASDLRAFGYQGKIVSFEPQTVPFKELEERSYNDPDWICVKSALGDSNSIATLNISEEKESSSLLRILPRHVDALPNSGVVGSEQIQIVELDSVIAKYANPKEKVFLKLDVQGFEEKVLKGAKECMPQIQGIQLEMSLKPLYEGEVLFSGLCNQMESMGFLLAWVESGFRNNRSGELLQLDGIFIRPHKSG